MYKRQIGAERLADVPIATPDEAIRERETFNATAHPVPDTTLAALLEAGMRRDPHAEALVFGETRLTHAELDRRSAALAAALTARGIGREAIVAVALPRSIELVMALVAILRAGAAYLPLDIDHPADRIAAILNASGADAVMAAGDPHGIYGDILFSPDHWPDTPTAFDTSAAPTDAAYVIYTSGSTGCLLYTSPSPRD